MALKFYAFRYPGSLIANLRHVYLLSAKHCIFEKLRQVAGAGLT